MRTAMKLMLAALLWTALALPGFAQSKRQAPAPQAIAAEIAAILDSPDRLPLPLERIRAFAQSVDRCLVLEEGDPYLVEQLRAAGIAVGISPDR